MNLPLNLCEAEALLCALGSYIPELERELVSIDRPRERHDLVEREELLRCLRERLSGVVRQEELVLPLV
jgi:hypothetical protein